VIAYVVIGLGLLLMALGVLIAIVFCEEQEDDTQQRRRENARWN
jgi:hypothetical protein